MMLRLCIVNNYIAEHIQISQPQMPPKPRSFPFHEYPKKSILSKMPSQFIGIAKQASAIKKQRIMSQQLFDNYNHEVSSIQKINRSLEKSLSKKKQQLKFVQAVRSRYIYQSLQKDKLNQLKEMELGRLRNKTMEERLDLETRMMQARQKMMKKKKSQSQLTKKQLTHYKSQKLLQQSRIYQKNQSRVKQIEQQKSRIREYYNRFYQNKNKKIMQNYRQIMKEDQRRQTNYKTQMKKLQAKLLLLKEDTGKKEKMLMELSQSIDSLRESRQSMRSSRHGSTRSMTPMEILAGDNPERPRLRLIKKQVQ